jgi:ribonuclease HI
VVTLYIDGAARGNPGPAGYGIVARAEDGLTLAEAYGYIGEQTNNFAEYCSLLAALELAMKQGWERIAVKSDSELLVKQVKGEYKVKHEMLRRFHQRAMQLVRRFEGFAIEYIRRSENKEADKLAAKAVKGKKSEPKGINPIVIAGC